MAVFKLAPMSRLVRVLTSFLLAIPIACITGALIGARVLVVPAAFLVLLYGWVWARMRPTRFVVHADRLEIIWPLKRRKLVRGDLAEVRTLDRLSLRDTVGWGMRVGLGGLWGAFGWLWTTRRGIVRMYVSRTDGLVWIAPRRGRPWLVTPEQPDDFVRLLSQ